MVSFAGLSGFGIGAFSTMLTHDAAIGSLVGAGMTGAVGAAIGTADFVEAVMAARPFRGNQNHILPAPIYPVSHTHTIHDRDGE